MKFDLLVKLFSMRKHGKLDCHCNHKSHTQLAMTISLNVLVVFAIIHKNGVVINAICHYALHDCSCHGCENYKDRWWNDRSKSKSKTQNKKTKIKTQKVKVKNMKCVRPKYKQIFIEMKQENVNTKKIKQGHGVRLYLRLILNRLKIVVVPFLFIPLWGPN